MTTHTWEERWDTLRMVRDAGMEVCCGGIVGMGETRAQRAEFAAQLAELTPDEVPLNFLNPRPGTPFGDMEPLEAKEALRTIAAFRLALPRTILRYAGGREITLGDLGTEQGLLGGINAVIVGNYLTTLGRPATSDLELLDRALDAGQGAVRHAVGRRRALCFPRPKTRLRRPPLPVGAADGRGPAKCRGLRRSHYEPAPEPGRRCAKGRKNNGGPPLVHDRWRFACIGVPGAEHSAAAYRPTTAPLPRL